MTTYEESIVGPGEDDSVRLVNSYRVGDGSILGLDVDLAGRVFWLELVSRGLGDADETLTQSFAFTHEHAVAMAQAMLRQVAGL